MLEAGEATMMPAPVTMRRGGKGETMRPPTRNKTQENFLQALAAEQERSKAHSTPLPVESIQQTDQSQDAAVKLMEDLMKQAPPLPAERTVPQPVISKDASPAPPIQDLKSTTNNISQEQVSSFMKNMSEGFKATVAKIKSFGKKVIETISAGKFWDKIFSS